MKNALSRKPAILTRSIAALLAISAFAPQSARAVIYYWDENGTTAGFGTAGSTWGTSQFWNTDSTGGGSGTITDPPTTIIDAVNFGIGASGLAAGTVTVSGTQNAQAINFASSSGAIVLSGGTAINLASAALITVNNASDTISTPITGAATSLSKGGIGTLILNGANTYTGTTIINAGTVQVGDGSNGSLNGTTGTALTFNGTSTFNVQEAASSTQGMGALAFSGGQGTVLSTAASGAATATLTFASMAARATGATGNFNILTNTTASQNKIVLTSTTNAPLSSAGSNNPGIFFGLNTAFNTAGSTGTTSTSFARYDTVNGYFRAVNYSGDTNATTTVAASTSATDLALTATAAFGASKTYNTIRLQTTSNNQRINVGNGNTLSVNGILTVVPGSGVASQVGTGTVGQGFLQPTSDGGEIVLAMSPTSGISNSSLQIGSVVQDFAGGSQPTKVTFTGGGINVVQASNTYTGATTINSGLVRALVWGDAGSVSGLGKGSNGTTPMAADIVINGGILNYGNTLANLRTNRLFTIGQAGATLDNSGNSVGAGNWTIGQNSDGTSSGSIGFSSSNAPVTLTLANAVPTASFFGTGTLAAVLGDPGTGANVTNVTKTGNGTWILAAANTYSGVTRIITGGTLQLGNNLAIQNSIFDPSGGGTLAFNTAIVTGLQVVNTPTFGGLTSGTNLNLASNVTGLTLKPGTGVTTTYSGVLSSATAGMTLTKTGAGTQVLSGVNTYTGATNVNAGKLTIGSTGTINTTSAVSIGAGNFNYNSTTALSPAVSFSGTGGTLSGSGTITPAVTVSSGNTLSPGNGVGTLGLSGGLTIADGGIFSWQNSTTNTLGTAGADWSVANVTGSTTISPTASIGSKLQLQFTSIGTNFSDSFWGSNQTWDLITGGVTAGNLFDASNISIFINGVVQGGGTNTITGLGTFTTVVSGSNEQLVWTASGGSVANQTFVRVSPASSINARPSSTVGLSGTLTNTGAGNLVVALTSTGTLSVTSLASDSSPVVSGTPATVTGTINTGTTAGAQGWQVTNTDAAAATPSASISGTVTVYDLANATYTGTALAFGNIHQGASSVSQSLGIGNQTVTNAIFQDLLDVSATTDNASVTSPGFNSLLPSGGGLTMSNLTFVANTATAGSLASTASLTLTSNANGVPGLSNGTATVVGSPGSITTTGLVYSGLSTWTGASGGSWGTLASGFGVNWGTDQGSPGLDAGFTSVDTATFGSTAGSVTVNLDGANPSLNAITFNTTGSYTVAQGTGGGLLTLAGGGASITAAGTQVISAPVTLAADVAVSVTGASDTLSLSGAIGETGGARNLTKSGSGTLTLSTTNTYTGATTIGAGTLNANSTAALGNSSATNTLIFTGGTLQAGGTITSAATRPVTLTSTGLIDSNGNAVSIAGIVSGAGGLTKSGAGTLTLSGANTYTGLTDVQAGTLALSGGAAIANTGAVNVAAVAGAELLVSASETIGSLSGGSVAGGAVTLGANTLTVGDASTTTFGGTITGTATTGTLVKQGTGVLNLAPLAVLSFDTLAANDGTLNVNSALGTGTGTGVVAVNNAGTKLRFGSVSQTLSSLTIGAGSTVIFTSGAASGAFSGGGKVASLGGSAVVPEPGTLGLLLVGAVGILNRRRRQG
ncbi:MAG: autotransporter-associated beta strand repeat-containing protein [Chthoniobacter sp.]|nr:autotransporter-associated beta strand repeat-containing protein [Chthoniobacter sp.]